MLKVTDLQALLTVIQNSVESLNTHEFPAALAAYQSLPQFVNKTQGCIEKLLKFIERDVLNESGKPSFRRWTPKTQQKLTEFKDSILESHFMLNSAVASANL